MEVFLILNGFEIVADSDEQERLMLGVAAGQLDRQRLEAWIDQHITALGG